MNLATLPKRQPTNRTMHDVDYVRVSKAIQRARALMSAGSIRTFITCPICGGIAWVLPRRENNGQACIAMCETGCFDCWE